MRLSLLESELLNKRFFSNEQDAEKVNVTSLLTFHEILILLKRDESRKKWVKGFIGRVGK